MTLYINLNSSPIRSGSCLTAPASQALAAVSPPRPGPPKWSSRCHAATRMVCEPCGRREAAAGGLGPTAPGSLGKVAVLAVPAAVSTNPYRRVPPVGHQPRRRTHAVAPPNRSSTLGRHRVPAADRPDAFEDRCSTGLAVAHLRNDDHPAQPHGIVTTLKRWACGWEPYRLVWFQTASSIEACTDHV